MFLWIKHFDPIQWNANDRYNIYYILTDSNVACYVVENFIIYLYICEIISNHLHWLQLTNYENIYILL